MKALSIRQPWAELIASGKKTLEVRSWQTHYRGPLLIVAARKTDGWWHPDDPETQGMVDDWIARLTRGAAVVLVELVDVRAGTVQDAKAACGDPTGRFVWVLKTPRRTKPVPIKGRLSLFEIDIEPETLLA